MLSLVGKEFINWREKYANVVATAIIPKAAQQMVLCRSGRWNGRWMKSLFCATTHSNLIPNGLYGCCYLCGVVVGTFCELHCHGNRYFVIQDLVFHQFFRHSSQFGPVCAWNFFHVSYTCSIMLLLPQSSSWNNLEDLQIWLNVREVQYRFQSHKQYKGALYTGKWNAGMPHVW